MKVRIGFGLGTRSLTNDDRFGPFVDDLERLRFDSLWLSERIGGESPDPVVGMAYAAGRTKKLKFGASVMVLPGRNPVLVAKSMASLDRHVRRPPAPCVRPRRRRRPRAAGVRDRARRASRVVRRGPAADPPPLDRGRRRPRRGALPPRRDRRAAEAGAEAPRGVAGRDRAVRAAARRAAGRRLAAVVHRARGEAAAAKAVEEEAAPSTSARSIPSTSAR